MDYIEGQTLSDYIAAKTEPPEADEVKAIFLPLLDALGYAHDNGIIHRDIKPSNIMISRDGKGELLPTLLDFGIAKIAEDVLGLGQAKGRTRTGARLGTPNYMSPEQIKGSADADVRSDIFSLAATLYELVTRTVPFDAPSDYEIRHKIVSGDLIAPRTLAAAVDPVIEACVVRGLASQPAGRFASCAALAALLEQAGRSSPASRSSTAAGSCGRRFAPCIARTGRSCSSQGGASRMEVDSCESD